MQNYKITPEGIGGPQIFIGCERAIWNKIKKTARYYLQTSLSVMRLYSSRPDWYIIQFGQLDGCTAEEMNCGGCCSCLAVFLYRGCMYVCRYALHMYDKRVASSFIKLSYSLAPHFFPRRAFHQGLNSAPYYTGRSNRDV